METYRCKRYRRSAPGQTGGVVIDEWTFLATSAVEAENKVRGMSRLYPVDWEKDFVTLEDDSGHVLATWHHGMLHA
jgi:hypothetical protein